MKNAVGGPGQEAGRGDPRNALPAWTGQQLPEEKESQHGRNQAGPAPQSDLCPGQRGDAVVPCQRGERIDGHGAQDRDGEDARPFGVPASCPEGRPQIAPDQGHRRQQKGSVVHLAHDSVPAVRHQGDEAQANGQVLEVEESQQTGAGRKIGPVHVLRRRVQQSGSGESRQAQEIVPVAGQPEEVGDGSGQHQPLPHGKPQERHQKRSPSAHLPPALPVALEQQEEQPTEHRRSSPCTGQSTTRRSRERGRRASTRGPGDGRRERASESPRGRTGPG